MQANTAQIKIIQRDQNGNRAARVDGPRVLIPAPGRYTLTTHLGKPDASLGQPLFQVGVPVALDDSELPFLGPIPTSWQPGDKLHLRRPTGHGFQLPSNIRRLTLAAFGETPARLLPLVLPAIQTGADIAFFTSSPDHASSLPPDVEIQPLNTLGDAISWGNFLAIDIPLVSLENLRAFLRLGPHDRIPCPTQALIWTPMPCGALADCGVCAVPTRKGSYRLACKDGPVFDLDQLVW